MLRKVKLYGELAKFVGHKEFEVKAETVGKAVSFLIHNFPGIESFMSPNYYQVKVGDYDVNEEEIHHPVGKQDIHFIPVISGAGRGIGKVLLGAVLIGIAIAAPGAGFLANAPAFANPNPVPIPLDKAKPCGTKNAAPINAAPNNIFPIPLPAPLITGIKCISSCPIGYPNSLSSIS